MFNAVLDGLIFTLSNNSVSLYDVQNELKPQLTHRGRFGQVSYTFRYRETSLLTTMAKKSVKMDLVRTSLLAVFIQDLSEILNLRALLDASLPRLAGLTLILFSVGFEPSKLAQRVGILGQLVNCKKISKIFQCPINLPQSTLFEEVRRHRVTLNVRDFARYLEFHIRSDLSAAIQ